MPPRQNRCKGLVGPGTGRIVSRHDKLCRHWYGRGMILDPVFLLLLAVALLLDALLGEPDWLWNRVPHPVVAMGRLIDRLDTLMNRGAQRRVAGNAALAHL